MIFLTHYLFQLLIMLILFTADIWSFFLIESSIFHLLLGFAIVQIVYFRSGIVLMVAPFLLAIASGIIYGVFGLSLLYATPILFLLFIFHPFLYQTVVPSLLASIICSLGSLAIEALFRGTSVTLPYAVLVIFANIGVIVLFSLKAKMGKTRQSLSQYMV